MLGDIFSLQTMEKICMRVKICDIEIDSYSCDQVVEVISHHAQSEKTPQYVVTPNAQHIVLLQNDARFQEVYRNAFLSVPDGVPLLWAAQFLKTPLSGRVNGTDLFEKLCEVAAHKGLKVFLLGGRPGVAEKTKTVLQQRYAQLNIVGTYCPPYGFESDSIELERINHTIKSASPHILFVALGSPKQELWIYNNYQSLGVPISLGIGASFELVSGVVPRAPKLMQQIGMEWFFRLLMEPRRLWKRYVVCNTLFIWLILKQRFNVFSTQQNA
jgi:N-acetylglucosaminyldiphosphoundecaprenol N-acetyl-beta-D-mannosaminyltransferase